MDPVSQNASPPWCWWIFFSKFSDFIFGTANFFWRDTELSLKLTAEFFLTISKIGVGIVSIETMHFQDMNIYRLNYGADSIESFLWSHFSWVVYKESYFLLLTDFFISFIYFCIIHSRLKKIGVKFKSQLQEWVLSIELLLRSHFYGVFSSDSFTDCFIFLFFFIYIFIFLADVFHLKQAWSKIKSWLQKFVISIKLFLKSHF